MLHLDNILSTLYIVHRVVSIKKINKNKGSFHLTLFLLLGQECVTRLFGIYFDFDQSVEENRLKKKRKKKGKETHLSIVQNEASLRLFWLWVYTRLEKAWVCRCTGMHERNGMQQTRLKKQIGFHARVESVEEEAWTCPSTSLSTLILFNSRVNCNNGKNI